MQKFHFRLESVLRLRSQRLAVERDKLAKTLADVARLEHSIEALATERAAAIAFVQNEPASGTTEMRALSAYLLGYQTRLAQAKRALETARLRLAEQRQRVVAADRDERLLLKLKEKKLVEWQIDADRELETLAQESWNAVHFGRGS